METTHNSFTEKAIKGCTECEAPFSAENLTCLVDLHLHLDGAISVDSVKSLATLTGTNIPETDEEITKLLRVSENCQDLNEFLEKFAFPCKLLSTPKAIKQAVATLLREEKELGVMYCEIRFAPQITGNNQEKAVLAAIEAIKEAEIPANLILCCMRGNENQLQNLETVELVKKYLGKGVAGMDLAGAEALCPTENFEDIFALAKTYGIPFTIHAGEAAGADSVATAVKFGAKRIGHGVRIAGHRDIEKDIAEKNITLELCPTSNMFTKLFRSYKEYPLLEFIDAGVRVTINTDNPSIEGITIKDEYRHMIEAFSLSKNQVKRLLLNSVDAAFATDVIKDRLRAQIESNFSTLLS
ncbi:MAG: adenosine deaminase [Sphaerochaetaceae bacterium]|nr:adenosine deaminase [Sphaerochaetaceae bacterium]